jgi:hypothetical protein
MAVAASLSLPFLLIHLIHPIHPIQVEQMVSSWGKYIGKFCRVNHVDRWIRVDRVDHAGSPLSKAKPKPMPGLAVRPVIGDVGEAFDLAEAFAEFAVANGGLERQVSVGRAPFFEPGVSVGLRHLH